MPKVSVLMPVYNTKEEYLRESVESILNQTYQDFELIILDDGSSKDISEVVSLFNDSRIKLYKNEKNLGVAKSRNKLLDLAMGEYVAWQDADDISYPSRLEKQVKFLDENQGISVVGSNLERFPHKKVISFLEYPKILDFIGGCAISQGTSMLRINNFKKNNLFYNENLITSEDYDFWSRTIQILKIANIQEVLLKYRRVNTSLCYTKNQVAFGIDKNIKNNLLNQVTEDEKLQKQLLETISKYYNKKASIFENLFSIRNEWKKDKKYKVLVLLGIKIVIKKMD